jgi:DNA-binding transcriptional LysR family regulator
MGNLELRHLRYFIAVAEELSFTRAAARLGIAQPPLSQQILQLEKQVGHPLLQRRPVVGLTLAGKAFLGNARYTVLHAERTLQAAQRAARAEPETIHLGIASSAVLTTLAGTLQAFRGKHSGTALRLHEMHSAEQLEALRSGVLDIGILREPAPATAFLTDELLREPLVAVIPARHRLARRQYLTADLLAAEPFVLFPRAVVPSLYDQIVALCREGGFAPAIEHEVREWHTAVQLVAAGFGVSIAPRGIANLRPRGVVFRPFRPSVQRAVLFLCRPADLERPAVTAFARFVLSRASIIPAPP